MVRLGRTVSSAGPDPRGYRPGLLGRRVPVVTISLVIDVLLVMKGHRARLLKARRAPPVAVGAIRIRRPGSTVGAEVKARAVGGDRRDGRDGRDAVRRELDVISEDDVGAGVL